MSKKEEACPDCGHIKTLQKLSGKICAKCRRVL